jgi:hypothetical protein
MSQSPSKKIASMWGNAMNKLGSIVSGDGDRREEEENHLPELDENLARKRQRRIQLKSRSFH